MKWLAVWGLAIAVLCCAPVSNAADVENELRTGLEKLSPHPRILLSDKAFDELKRTARSDKLLKRYIGDIIARADRSLNESPRKHGRRDGLRFGREQHVGFVPYLAFAYRWTKDKKYIEPAVRAMREVAAFPDWNPGHFLCTAGMMNNVSMGYDWLYDVISEEDRKIIAGAIIRHGLKSNSDHPTNRTNNWGGVCNAGIVFGALAIADADKDLAFKMLKRSIDRFPRSMKQYAPDGAWYEGAGYWNYMTAETFRGIEALRVAFGTDFDLMKMQGVAQTAWFPIHATGPTSFVTQYADVGDVKINRRKLEPRTPRFYPDMFLLGRIFNQSVWIELRHRGLENGRAELLDVIYFQKRKKMRDNFPRSIYFSGSVETFFSRSAWNDPNAAWVSVKAGLNNVPHGQLDAGTFEYEVDNVRWAYDLGKDDYNMPGYFGSKRWDYYRNVSESHNVMLINGKGQPVNGRAVMVDTDIKNGSVTMDMKGAYNDPTLKSYKRTIALMGKKLTVTDDLRFSADAKLHWGMTIDADISILSDGRALLNCNGKGVMAKIVEPKGLTFAEGSCKRPPPEDANDGYRRLTVDWTAVKDQPAKLVILLEPSTMKGKRK